MWSRHSLACCRIATPRPLSHPAAVVRTIRGPLSGGPATPPHPATSDLLERLKYLDEPALRVKFAQYERGDGLLDADGVASFLGECGRSVGAAGDEAPHVVRALAAHGTANTSGGEKGGGGASGIAGDASARTDGLVSFGSLKVAVDAAARRVDKRVFPIFATLTLSFTSQGTQFPVLPQLARSLELTPADLGLITSCAATGRLLWNVPAAELAERAGRRALLITGPAISALGTAGLGVSTCFWHLAASNLCIGVGMASAMAGAGLYLADISTPKNRAQTNVPMLQSALIGFAIGPAVGGVLASSFGLHLPFFVCAGGLIASSAAAFLLLPETMHESRARRESFATGTAALAATAPAPSPSPPVFTGAGAMLGRPALQGLSAVVFMNGFGQARCTAEAPQREREMKKKMTKKKPERTSVATLRQCTRQCTLPAPAQALVVHCSQPAARSPQPLTGPKPRCPVHQIILRLLDFLCLGIEQGAMPVTMVLFGMENLCMDGMGIGAMMTVSFHCG